MPASDRYTSCGKQVLEDGIHFADARSHKAAEAIASALNRTGMGSGLVRSEEKDRG